MCQQDGGETAQQDTDTQANLESRHDDALLEPLLGASAGAVRRARTTPRPQRGLRLASCFEVDFLPALSAFCERDLELDFFWLLVFFLAGELADFFLLAVVGLAVFLALGVRLAVAFRPAGDAASAATSLAGSSLRPPRLGSRCLASGVISSRMDRTWGLKGAAISSAPIWCSREANSDAF